ncbi:hypothetical protein AB0E66_28245 [Streptomyces sp. NPDC033753]|uniref:hypothetical protein n=1 Tax=Streptomyces sp. NPDC033753 TaxID=3155128 RepID=UPI0033C5C76E
MADLESFAFAEPAVATCFADALAEVVDELDEPAAPAWVDLEDGTADASVFVFARGSVGTAAGARGDLAQLEVLLEVRATPARHLIRLRVSAPCRPQRNRRATDAGTRVLLGECLQACDSAAPGS